jgi:hypothetical protein
VRCQGLRRRKSAAVLAVGTDKVGVAKITHCGGAVFFSASPQIAFAEAAENRCATGLGTFAL